jgi:hypothetical protein
MTPDSQQQGNNACIRVDIPATAPPDYASVAEALTHRIYHEDGLLGTRSYNFLTAQAFLATALATTIAGQIIRHQRLFALLICGLGLCIGLIHAIVASRTLASIGFWRTRLKEIEEKLPGWIPFDANLEDVDRLKRLRFLGVPFQIRTVNILLSWVVPFFLAVFWMLSVIWICYSIQ